MSKQITNFNGKLETVNNHQMKFIEIENTISKIKNLLGRT